MGATLGSCDFTCFRDREHDGYSWLSAWLDDNPALHDCRLFSDKIKERVKAQ